MNFEQLLNDMTLDEKLGQMFLLAFEKHRLDEARVLFEEYFVGSSYISNDNVPTINKAVELTTQLQNFAARTRLKIPLILGVDQEGAWGVIVPESCTGPGNMALGATHNPDDAYAVYQVYGNELRAVGLNAIFAPSADCNSNPHNSIIGMRAFGEKPRLVAAMTEAAVRGAHAGGIITTIKHFPGHGDTRLDSHRGIPRVERTRAELDAIDLYPFTSGIKADSDMVMTSHIIFSAIDQDNPATLSSIILGDVLRGEMGFDGVIISDSMNMQAILKNYTSSEAAIRAFNAGVDLLMLAEEHYSHNAAAYLEQQTSLIRAVKAAVESGRLPLERVNDAVRRVLRLKQKFADVLREQPSIERAVTNVGSDANRQVELEASRHAVEVFSDKFHHLPIAPARSIILINTTARTSYEILGATRGIGPNQTTPAFDYFLEAMRGKFSQLDVRSADDMRQSNIKSAIGSVELIIAVTENYPLPGVDFDQTSQLEIIKQLVAIVPDRLIVVALRDPYELADLPELPAYVCAFSFRPCAAQAAVEVLGGQVQPTGKSPVSIPNTHFVANEM